MSTFTEISGCFQPGQAKVGPRPTPLVEPPWGAEPRFELGPALQQASALPTEPHCTLTELHCTLTEPHCTLMSHTAPREKIEGFGVQGVGISNGIFVQDVGRDRRIMVAGSKNRKDYGCRG